MRKIFTLLACCLFSGWLGAQDEGVRLSGEELKAFLPGTKVSHLHKNGSQRYWTNSPDGSFVASSDNKHFGSAMGSQSRSAPGKWRINDDGQYCVEIEWGRVSEKWCAAILKTPSGEFYLNTVAPDRRIEFSK
jgi:hypothetical protein